MTPLDLGSWAAGALTGSMAGGSEVTSPGGTTAAAVAALEAGGVRSAFADAMTACRDRAAGLS